MAANGRTSICGSPAYIDTFAGGGSISSKTEMNFLPQPSQVCMLCIRTAFFVHCYHLIRVRSLQVTYSSTRDEPQTKFSQCRGHFSSSLAWTPNVQAMDQWMQFDFGCLTHVCGIAMANNVEVGGVCVSSILVRYQSMDSKEWIYVDGGKALQISRVCTVRFETCVVARLVQVRPQPFLCSVFLLLVV